MPTERITCPHCRSAIEPGVPAQDGTRTCPHCGGVIAADARGVTEPEAVPLPATAPNPPRKRSAWVTALIVVPAVAVVVGAAASVTKQLGWLDPGPGIAVSAPVPDPALVVATATLAAGAAPGGAPGVTTGPGAPASARETVMVPVQAMVARFQVYPGAGAGDRPVVVALPALWTDAPEATVHGPHFGSLARLIMEQAVLGASRDDLGTATRAMSLGEDPPPGKPELSAVLVTPYRAGERIRWTVRRGGFDGPVVADAKLELLASDPSAYPAFVAMAEGYARGPFAEGFKKAGLSARPDAVRAATRGDADAEAMLDTLSFPAQFTAVRALHASARNGGESPERLGALVRGYANLGTLTEFQWTASNKLFKARALLYAQRMLAKDRLSPWPRWHRAYALALSGLHRDALADLDAARKLSAVAGTKPAEPPDWVELIDAYCRFDTPRLAKAVAGPRGRLAQFLRFYTVENYFDSHRQTLDTAREALRSDPECFRLIDALCQVGGVANGHEATTLGPQVLTATLPKRLLAMKGLPAKVAEAAARGGDGAALADALTAAGVADGDDGEPSWAVLGRLVRETQFVHVWRRVAFMRDSWSVPVGETILAARPLLADSPYRMFVESYGADPRESTQWLLRARRKINPADIELTSMPFLLAFAGFDPNSLSDMFNQVLRQADETYRDLQTVGRTLQGVDRVATPYRLRSVSPECPEAVALLIEDHWGEVAGHARQWERRYAGHPAVLARLALRYGKLGRADDERRCLEQYNREAPARWAYERLAAIHLEEGHPDLWRSTLEAFLETPDDFALDHAKVRVELAHHFMRRGEYGTAMPYAETAARTWAAWAMECAAECHEGAGEFDEAETWFRNEAERYPTMFLQWFLFCKRTGHGDVKKATRWAGAFFEGAGNGMSENEKALAVVFYDLSGDPAGGAEFLRSLPTAVRPTDGQPGGRLPRWCERLFLARFADALDDAKGRDAAWAEVARGDHPTAAELAALFLKASAGAFDRKAFDALMAGDTASTQGYGYYFAGRFLEKRGQIEDAAGCWERSAAVNPGATLEPLLGLNALRSRGLPTGHIPEDPALYLLRAGSHKDAGRPDLTLKDLDDAIRLDPKSASAFVARGDLNRAEGRTAAALGDYDEAVRLDPSRPQAFNNRGVTRRASGDLDGALSDFGRVIELTPNDPVGHAGRGITYVLQGKDDLARRDIDRAIAASPRDGFGYGARALLALARGEEGEADRSFGKAVDLDPAVAAPIERLKKLVKERRPKRP